MPNCSHEKYPIKRIKSGLIVPSIRVLYTFAEGYLYNFCRVTKYIQITHQRLRLPQGVRKDLRPLEYRT